jgi:hypothetical protein
MSKLLLRSALIALMALTSGLARAAVFTCTSASCPDNAGCTGDTHLNSGCTVSCYVAGPGPGQSTFSGSATCSGGGGS